MKKRRARERVEPSPQARPEPSSRVIAVLLVLFVLLMAAARWHVYDEPLEMDGSTYAVIARELREGRQLYTEVWDHKPPAIYVSYAVAQVIAGYGPGHVYLMGLFLATVTLLGVYFAAQQAAGATVGLYAALFWTVVATDLNFQADQPNCEVFINACVVWAFALIIRMPGDRQAYERAISIGALFGLASLYKNVLVATAAAIVVAHLAAARLSRRSLIDASVIATVIAACWAGVIAYFAMTGRYTAFVATVFEFNRAYAGDLWGNLVAGMELKWLVPSFASQLWPLAVLGLLGLGLSRGTVSPRVHLLLLAFFVGTFISIALPGRFLRHYYQLWLPPFCLAAAFGAAALSRIAVRPRLLPVAAMGTAALLAAFQLLNFVAPAQQLSVMKFGDRFVLSMRAAELINHLLRPQEMFFQWGHQPDLYFYSGRRPVGGEFRSRYLVAGPPERTAQLLRDLEANHPELIVVVTDTPFPEEHPVPRWITQNYQPLAAAPCDTQLAHRYLLLGRRGGRLQAEVQPGACLHARTATGS